MGNAAIPLLLFFCNNIFEGCHIGKMLGEKNDKREGKRLRECVICDNTGLQAVVLPQKGATVKSLSYNGEEYLYQNIENIASAERPRCGIPFIFPSFGRLKDSCFIYSGKTYEMGIHGFAHISCWQVRSHTEDSVTLVLTDTAQTYVQYPFHFRVELSFSVSDGVLTVKQNYVNQDEKPMPYNYGFHPYFQVPALAEPWVQLPAGRFSGNVPAGAGELSCVIQRNTGPAVFSASSDGPRVRMEFDESFSTFVLWRPSDSNFLCAEPICGMPDGLNTKNHQILKPGESRSAVVRFCLAK
jgi:galactose mutarotase-like enzyme